MKKQEILYHLNKILEIDKEIALFYQRYTAQLLITNMPLSEALNNGRISFDPLNYLLTEEDEIYIEFMENPTNYLKILRELQTEEEQKTRILDGYKRANLDNITYLPIIPRIKEKLEDYHLDLTIHNIMEECLGSTNIDSYHISHFCFQDPTLIEMKIKSEYLRTFLTILQKTIDLNIQFGLKESACQLIQLENHILMQNPITEFDFTETFFVYDDPVELDCIETIEEYGASKNVANYLNEKFVKEQGIDQINRLMSYPLKKLECSIELLYLNATIIQSREESSISYLKDYFRENYSKNIDNIEDGRKKEYLVSTTLNEIDKVREGFVYIKKTDY